MDAARRTPTEEESVTFSDQLVEVEKSKLLNRKLTNLFTVPFYIVFRKMATISFLVYICELLANFRNLLGTGSECFSTHLWKIS